MKQSTIRRQDRVLMQLSVDTPPHEWSPLLGICLENQSRLSWTKPWDLAITTHTKNLVRRVRNSLLAQNRIISQEMLRRHLAPMSSRSPRQRLCQILTVILCEVAAIIQWAKQGRISIWIHLLDNMKLYQVSEKMPSLLGFVADLNGSLLITIRAHARTNRNLTSSNLEHQSKIGVRLVPNVDYTIKRGTTRLKSASTILTWSVSLARASRAASSARRSNGNHWTRIRHLVIMNLKRIRPWPIPSVPSTLAS